RGFLELDHRLPRALGGAGDAGNVSVKCRSHNALAAERIFGRAHVDRKKAEEAEKKDHLRQRGYDAAKAARALSGLGFKRADIRRALAKIEVRWAGSPPSLETILREAVCVLT